MVTKLMKPRTLTNIFYYFITAPYTTTFSRKLCCYQIRGQRVEKEKPLRALKKKSDNKSYGLSLDKNLYCFFLLPLINMHFNILLLMKTKRTLNLKQLVAFKSNLQSHFVSFTLYSTNKNLSYIFLIN